MVDVKMGHILANIHDEVLGEKDNTKISNEKFQTLALDIMTGTFKLKNVPVETDFKFINNWREGK